MKLNRIVKALMKSGLPEKAAEYVYNRADEMLQDEKADRESFRETLAQLSDDELTVYIPDVYQKNIYKIDYERLQENGIKLISFDIDDTIDDSFINKFESAMPMLTVTMPNKARKLVRKLKSMGFTVVLLTNAHEELAREACADLKADGYIARAKKPETGGFEAIAARYGVEPPQMAHIGNSIRADIAGGNRFGVTTCLVRRAGTSMKLVKAILKKSGVPTKNHLIRERLLERGIWRKHYMYRHGDQYYQLGGEPEYRNTGAKDKAVTLDADGFLRSTYKEDVKSCMKTLRKHLGGDIVFTGLWADAKDERELEESELLEGELSGFLFTIGGYSIRSSVCLYQDDDAVPFQKRVPVSPDIMARYRQTGGMSGADIGFRKAEVISARYAGAEDWRHVCLAAASHYGCRSESINFIGTVKASSLSSDEQEVLFVHKRYAGDSFSAPHWYRLSADGTVTVYESGPYGLERGDKQ